MSLLKELWAFMKVRKKWWLLPIILVMMAVGALLVFFVFALQCTSTIAIIKRETNSWRWPAFAFTYLFILAYVASFTTHRIVGALV